MSLEIQKKLQSIFDNFSIESKNDLIFELLRTYGVPKSTITRLRKGDLNRSKKEGEILFSKKVIFRTEEKNQLLIAIDDVAKDSAVSKYSPRFAIIADHEYTHLVAKDLKLGKSLDIQLHELPQHYDFFLPLAGSEVYNSSNDNEADRNAAYKMAVLYDHLKEDNPNIYQSDESIHHLNVFLSRLLFCFFAEDTGIFPIDSIFTDTLAQHTDNSGRDTHTFLENLFERLNTKDNSRRYKEFPAFLQQFPYVNGGLFQDNIKVPLFSAKSRQILIELGNLQWKDINPDIFGSMIQAVTTGEERSKLGQHYTSVPNILKLIKPLFLDELYKELEKATTVKQLYQLQKRIANIKFFDPACGSGNFLIITYKELRVLEIELFKKILDIENYVKQFFSSQIKISQFYGIEIDDFAHKMAILSLWLAEHQMNIIFEERLFEHAQVANILPLKDIGKIHQGNATRINWKTVCPITADDEVYVIGNPPYYGSRKQSAAQKDDLKFVFKKNYKSLDYICAWFYKGAEYIENHNAKCAFVSTNSICQGLLVALTWKRIFEFDVEIDFAYESFKWKNNAKGNAGVTVIIIGLRSINNNPKYIFRDKFQNEVKNINPYLIPASNILVEPLNKSLSAFPPMDFGNMPADGGNLLFTTEEKNYFLSQEPEAEKWIKPILSAHEFLNGENRYCLWLEDVDKKEYSKLPLVLERVCKTFTVREISSRPKLALIPHLFAQITQKPNIGFILIPRHSSEKREYIPIGFFDKNYKASDSNLIVSTEEAWLFAVLTSKMHMVWVRAVGGRLKTDYRYSSTLCYNTFPFPPIDLKQKEILTQYVFDILEVRANHTGKTMAWMYNPDTMPNDLKQAHQALDEAVEKCYRLEPFDSDSERLEYLFKLYEKMIAKEDTNKRRV